jgi:hypothetical protein
MSELSSRILEVAMDASSNVPLTAIVAAPNGDTNSPLNKNIWVTFPLDGFPAESQITRIPTDDNYLDALRHHLSERANKCLVIVPPYTPHKFLPPTLSAQFPRLDYDQIVFQHIADWLPTGASIGLIQPAAFLQNKSSRDFRTALFTVLTPKLLVTNLIPYTGNSLHLAMSLLVVEKNATNRLLRFFRCPDSSPDLPVDVAANDLSRLLKQGGGKTTYGYIVREGLPPDAPLVHALYDPALADQMKDLSELGQLRRLADFADILRTGYAASRLGSKPK